MGEAMTAKEVWLIEALSGPADPRPGEWRVLVGMTSAGATTEQGAERAMCVFKNSAVGARTFRDGIYSDMRLGRYVRAE